MDVSTYLPVVWVERDGEECTTEFVEQCEQKSESVCAEVTETFCEVSVWCKLSIMSIASVRYHYKAIRPEKDIWQNNHLASKTFYLKVFPFTNCKTVTEPQQFRETKLTAKKFIQKSCTQSKRTIPHKKLLPDCKNVTKQNCVLTNWETDKYGNQVRNTTNITHLLKGEIILS